MNEYCERLIKEMNELLADPTKHSFAYAAQRIYDMGYVAGAETVRKELRIKLGLEVPGDEP